MASIPSGSGHDAVLSFKAAHVECSRLDIEFDWVEVWCQCQQLAKLKESFYRTKQVMTNMYL
jgi:hypothetical protein